MSEKLPPIFKLLKTNETIVTNPELMQSFHEVNNVLDNSCQIALNKPIKGRNMVLMTDASFTAAGDALMTEDNPELKLQSKRKSILLPSDKRHKTVQICERFLGNLFAIDRIRSPYMG